MLKLLLCLKYISRKKLVLMSVFAVALCTALLISVASMFTGFIHSIEAAATDHMGDVTIGSPFQSLKITHADILQDRLEALPEVEAASPVLASRGLLLLGKGNVRMVAVLGIDFDSHKKVTSLGESLISGGDESNPFQTEDDSEKVRGILGLGVAAVPDAETDEYDLEEAQSLIGKKVVLMTGAASEVADENDQSKFERKNIGFYVSDLYRSGVYEFDSNFVFLPLNELSNKMYPYFTSSFPLANSMHMKLKQGVDEQIALQKIYDCWQDFAKNYLGWNPNWIEYKKVQTTLELQRDLIGEYRKQMGMLMLVFGIVSAGVIMLISCIFYMIVVTRKKDIAIIKSFGGSNGTVFSIFLSFGFVVGLAGSGVGIFFGNLFTKNANEIENWIRVVFGLKIWKSSTYMFSRIPTEVDWNSAIWLALIALAAAVIGSLIPAVIAARIRPIKILRYE